MLTLHRTSTLTSKARRQRHIESGAVPAERVRALLLEITYALNATRVVGHRKTPAAVKKD